jgi:hypothetical protein
MHREAEHPSSTHAWKKIWILTINMEISINTKTRLQVMTWSLVFVLKLISPFTGQNKEFFMHLLKKMFCFSVYNPWEKTLKSFPFKVILSWKQCGCDVIIERVYSRSNRLTSPYSLGWTFFLHFGYITIRKISTGQNLYMGWHYMDMHMRNYYTIYKSHKLQITVRQLSDWISLFRRINQTRTGITELYVP